MNWKLKHTFLLWGAFLILFSSCENQSKKFRKSPVDEMIRDMVDEPVFSILLHDMDAEEGWSSVYKHQYAVIKEVDGKPVRELTPWKEVGKRFFSMHENNMGMEIASKDSTGKISKVAAPPGYSRYVGNSRYGNWQGSGGSSFWVFYGQYAFMRSMFGYGAGRVYHHDYNSYHSSYRGRRAYYGTRTGSGKTSYGTYSSRNASQRSKSNFFKRSSSRTGWSGSTKRSRGGGGWGK